MQSKIKTLLLALIVICSALILNSGCSTKRTLLFLNWGEYINDDMVAAFEELYNCDVIVDIADSNELFYAKLKSGTTAYDLCCPAEYMVEKMYLNNLIQEIDTSKLPNYDPQAFMDGVVQIETSMNETMKEICSELGRSYDYEGNEINKYHMPYFWGTFGLMYNKTEEYFKDENTYSHGELISNTPDGDPDVLQRNDAWKVYFFDESVPAVDQLPLSFKVGAYGDSVRFNYGAAMTYYAGDPNVKVSDYQDAYASIMGRRKYAEWGGDSLKHGIQAHNLDIAFAYTGDCLDMIYQEVQDGLEFEEVEFNTYTPELTMAHIDTLVIPHNSRHVDLALEFINFLLEPENAWLNNRDIGYCPPLKAVYNMIVNEEGPTNPESVAYFELTDEEIHWRRNWAKIIKQTFPIDEQGKSLKEGIPFSYFDSSDIKIINNIVNNIKANTNR